MIRSDPQAYLPRASLAASCDGQLVADGAAFPVHVSALRVASQRMERELSPDTEWASIPLPGCARRDVQAFLTVLYSPSRVHEFPGGRLGGAYRVAHCIGADDVVRVVASALDAGAGANAVDVVDMFGVLDDCGLLGLEPPAFALRRIAKELCDAASAGDDARRLRAFERVTSLPPTVGIALVEALGRYVGAALDAGFDLDSAWESDDDCPAGRDV